MNQTTQDLVPAFLLEQTSDLPLVNLQITLRRGAATDPVAQHGAGLCYFATRLMRRGAGGRTRAEIDEAVDRLGASLTVHCGRESVLFELFVLKYKLEEACRIFSDVILRPDFPAEEADKLRREMAANLDDLRDDDHALAWRFFVRGLYGEHPYGRPVTGLPESWPHLSAQRARAWREEQLVSGNLVFGAAGDISSDELRGIYERHFSQVPLGPLIETPLDDPPAPAGLRLHLIDKPERTQSQILIGQPAPAWRDPAWLPLFVSTTAFGGPFSARLMNEVRVKRGLSYGAQAQLERGRGRHALWVHVFPSSQQTAETLELVLRLYREWSEAGISEEELAFAKSYLEKGFAFRLETPESRLSLRTDLLLCGMPADHMKTFPARVRAVTRKDVEAAQRHLRPLDLFITLVGTASTLLPELSKVEALRGVVPEVFPYDTY